ncbi:relaxase/mobilization nuclease domain-containing protein [Empedobacter falsenii]
MISKAKATKGSAAAIDYIMKEEKKSYELYRNDVIGQNGAEILSEFREVQAMNEQCKNNTFSIVLSPNNDVVHHREELLRYTKDHLKNLGLENNQCIAYVHQNTKATHIHIIANRIDEKGKALDDSYIGFKAQNSAEKIALENGLKTAKEVRKEKEISRTLDKDLNKEIKADIYKKHNISVKQSRTFSEYMQNMYDKGCRIEPTINKGGKLQGFRIHDKLSGLDFKASEINKNCGMKSMMEKGISFKGMTMQTEIVKGLTKEVVTKPVEVLSLLQPVLKIADVAIKVGRSMNRGMSL